MNNPVKYNDPTGHDPLDAEWERDFYMQNNRAPTDQDRQDRLYSLMYHGSGEDGNWTPKDWEYYAEHRVGLWEGQYPLA